MSDTSDLPRHIEVEADSVEEAIQQGLDMLNLSRAEVTVEVLDEGGRGVLGLGGRAARVRLTEGDVPYTELVGSDDDLEVAEEALEEAVQPAAERQRRAPEPPQPPSEPDDEVELTREVLSELLEKLHIEAEIVVRRAEADDYEGDPPWILDVQGEDLGVLIGRRGETLNALQYICRLIVSRDLQRRANMVIDVEGYKSRREDTLRRLAHRMADEARHRGKMVKLEPMPPNERRIIHIALRDDQTVYTESEGTGDSRKVTIKLRRDLSNS